MGAGKIAHYYRDSEKQAMDSHALALASYRRSLTVDISPAWRIRRSAVYARRHLVERLDRLNPGLVAKLRQLRARPV
jgi:hypothetical protein